VWRSPRSASSAQDGGLRLTYPRVAQRRAGLFADRPRRSAGRAFVTRASRRSRGQRNRAAS
jgi:hypothetical protein